MESSWTTATRGVRLFIQKSFKLELLFLFFFFLLFQRQRLIFFPLENSKDKIHVTQEHLQLSKSYIRIIEEYPRNVAAIGRFSIELAHVPQRLHPCLPFDFIEPPCLLACLPTFKGTQRVSTRSCTRARSIDETNLIN